MNVNFCDKNFVIATFFRDYRCTEAPMRTVHVVAPPTIFICGVGLEVCKCEEKWDIFSSNSALRFWQFTRSVYCAGYMYVHVHARTCTCSLATSAHVAMHTARSHAHRNTKYLRKIFVIISWNSWKYCATKIQSYTIPPTSLKRPDNDLVECHFTLIMPVLHNTRGYNYHPPRSVMHTPNQKLNSSLKWPYISV